MVKYFKKILSFGLIAGSMFGLFACGGKEPSKHDEMDEGTRIELDIINYSDYLSISYSCEDYKKSWLGDVVGYTVNFSVSGNKYLYYSNVSITLAHDVKLLNTDGIYIPQPTDYLTAYLDKTGSGKETKNVEVHFEHRGTSKFFISSVSGYVTKI